MEFLEFLEFVEFLEFADFLEVFVHLMHGSPLVLYNFFLGLLENYGGLVLTHFWVNFKR